MNPTLRALAPAALLLAHLHAQAAHLDFTLTATFEMPQIAAGPLHSTMTFSLDEPVATVQQVPGVAMLQAQPVDWTLAGSAGAATTPVIASIGWFQYPDMNYYGIDVRLPGALPNDLYQFIWLLPMSPYDGSDNAPDFKLLDLQSLGGEVCYYATGGGACTYTATFSDGGYTVAAASVPEPATAWLMLSGLALVAWRRRTRRPAGSCVAGPRRCRR